MSSRPPHVPLAAAEAQLGCEDLQPTLDFFVRELGFRIEAIFPADEPKVATLSGHGLRLRLAPGGDPGRLRIPSPDAGRVLVAPNGARIELVDPNPPVQVPPLAPGFVLTRAGEGPPPGEGRAGMLYRDLIPGRLGGRFIGSHITIPEGGPVADWVHFHKVRFQMIFCRRGWVRLVYEDQGEPFVMSAGDFVLQPPRIRHRVLESSPGLEVVELGCPALHETLAEHDMALPNGRREPDRDFDGQRFIRHVAANAPWTSWADGFEAQESGLSAAIRGLAGLRVLRPAGGTAFEAVADPAGELMFGFILEGAAVLAHAGDHAVGAGDAFVIPPGGAWGLREASGDLRLLQVTLPG